MGNVARCSIATFDSRPCGKFAPHVAVDWDLLENFRVCEECKSKLHSFYDIVTGKSDIHYATNKLRELRRSETTA